VPKSAVQRLHEDFSGITASKAATIAGVNPYQSPFALYQEMTGEAPPREQTFPMWLGTQMEGIVIRAFTKETGLKCRRPHRAVDPNFWFVTEEYGFPMGALLDAITIDSSGEAGIEAKTASAFLAGDWEDDVPVHYMMQIQHQLAVTGFDHFYAAAIVGNKYVQHMVKRDDDLIAMLTDKERKFYWEHLVAGVPPDVDGEDSTTAAIRSLFPRSEPEVSEVNDDPEIERLAMTYQSQGKTIEKLKKEREETGNRLKLILETRESLVSRSRKISWKTQTASRFDLKAFRAAGWDKLVDMYMTESETRPLKVTEVKS